MRSLRVVGAGASWGRAGLTEWSRPSTISCSAVTFVRHRAAFPWPLRVRAAMLPEPLRTRDSERSRFSDEGMAWRKTIDNFDPLARITCILYSSRPGK